MFAPFFWTLTWDATVPQSAGARGAWRCSSLAKKGKAYLLMSRINRIKYAANLLLLFISVPLADAQVKPVSIPTPIRYQRNGSILDIQYVNPMPTFDTTKAWSPAICSNNIWLTASLPRWEWTPVLKPTAAAEDRTVGIIGVIQAAQTSGDSKPGVSFGDVWFDHPFGSDYDMDVAWPANANQDYLVAPPVTNNLNDPDYVEQNNRNQAALKQFGPGGKAIHVEMESGLLPNIYRPQLNDSVAVFGRWIVDCGHDAYQSEIHPPLLLVRATPNGNLSTQSHVISRPFLAGQDFDGEGLYDYLLKQLGQLVGLSLGTGPFALIDTISARTNVLTTPFSGLHIFIYKLRPPVQRPPNMKLLVSYHFTVKSSVAVQLSNVGDADGTVAMIVVLNQIGYKPATLTQRTNMTVPLSAIEQEHNLGPFIKGAQAGGTLVLANPAAAAVLQKGVQTDQYTVDPNYAEPPDIQRFADTLPGITEVTVDDNQPYPIRGSIKVSWGTDPATIGPITVPGRTDTIKR